MSYNHEIDLSPFRHLYPFTSHYRKINGFHYHYLDEGDGEPVVMVHGNPTWSFYFRELVKNLSPRYRVIVPDHIGCGLSEKPSPDRYPYRLQNRIDDLETLLEKLDISESVTYIVHDWGGAIGLAVALKRLKSVRRTIILNTAAFFPPCRQIAAMATQSNPQSLPFRHGGRTGIEPVLPWRSIHGCS